jgi:hypothetical protein
MLEFLGEGAAAARITKAVSDWLAAPDPTFSTVAVGDAIAERV